MSRRSLSILAASAALALAACAGGAATTAPSEAPAGSEQPASDAPAGSDAAGGGAVCDVSTDPPTQTVAIANFAFPAGITAGVGDVIGFQNDDSAPHTATLDDDSCTTGNISTGTVQSLVFNEPGDYPFHCKVHPNMTGTITVTG